MAADQDHLKVSLIDSFHTSLNTLNETAEQVKCENPQRASY